MRRLLLTAFLLIIAIVPEGAPAACNTSTALCYATGSGDITDATKFACTGSPTATVPGNGVYVVIGSTFTITVPPGTYGSNGNGICTTRIEQTATLCSRASGGTAGTCSTPNALTTWYVGSTGNNPIGSSGTNANPGSDATMHGFFNGAGTFNLTRIKIISGDGASPVYLARTTNIDVNTGSTSISTAGTNGTHSATYTLQSITFNGWVTPACGVTGYANAFDCVGMPGPPSTAVIDIEHSRFDAPTGNTGAVRAGRYLC